MDSGNFPEGTLDCNRRANSSWAASARSFLHDIGLASNSTATCSDSETAFNPSRTELYYYEPDVSFTGFPHHFEAPSVTCGINTISGVYAGSTTISIASARSRYFVSFSGENDSVIRLRLFDHDADEFLSLKLSRNATSV